MDEELIFLVADKVAMIQVNRPMARNALNWAAQEGFARAVTAVSTDPTIRTLIITGSGTQSFVAGGDLKELNNHADAEAAQRLYKVMNEALQQLTALPIPVIGAVNGDAFGGGCEILTACDLRIASNNARFSFAQVRNALTTGWGGAGRLVRLLGQSRAMELLLTGRVFSAAEAQQMGFVHRLTAEPVLAVAQAWAAELVALPRGALAGLKQLVGVAGERPLNETNALEQQLFAALWPQSDHMEAMQAFVEKRPPVFNRE